MKGGRAGLLILALALTAVPAHAHSVPFSYVDVRLDDRTIDLTIVAHVFDIAHELGIARAETLLDASVLRVNAVRIESLVDERLNLTDGGALNSLAWDPPTALPDRESVELHRRLLVVRPAGAIVLLINLFPYDRQHQTFVNFYERNSIQSQALMDHTRTRFDYVVRGPRGIATVTRRFLIDGARHILTNFDHLVFLAGLLLTGGTLGQVARLSGAFSLAQASTIAIVLMGWLNPQPQLVEPAIALSIIYVGVDNLLVRDGRDVRVWTALAFGLIHGFAVAVVLRGLGLQPQALRSSIVAFSMGVLLGQLAVLGTFAMAFTALKSRNAWFERQFATVGSVAVMAAGAFWFIQRVFFSRSIS